MPIKINIEEHKRKRAAEVQITTHIMLIVIKPHKAHQSQSPENAAIRLKIPDGEIPVLIRIYDTMCSEGKQQDEGEVVGEQPDSEIKNGQNI
jgi:hypothetical protein